MADANLTPHKEIYARIAALADEKSFVETQKHIGLEHPGEGLVAGYAVINQSPVFLYAHDHSVLKGALGKAQAQKLAGVLDRAAATKTPVVGILKSDGARVNEGLSAVSGYAEIMKSASALRARAPHIVVLEGAAVGAMAVFASLADFIILCPESSLSVGPSSVTGLFQNPGKAAENGLGAFTAGSAAEADALLKKLLSFFAAGQPGNDDVNRLAPALENFSAKEDILPALSEIADNRNFLETYAAFAPEVVTGFLRIDGIAMAVVAHNGKHGLRISANGLKKAETLLAFAKKNAFPVLTLVNTDGFAVCGKEEEMGLAQLAARVAALYAEISETLPVITFAVGRAVGAASAVFGSRGLGADYIYAWGQAQLGIVPPETGVVLSGALLEAENPLEERESLEAKYAQQHMSAAAAAAIGMIDEPIPAPYTRPYIAAALNTLAAKSGK